MNYKKIYKELIESRLKNPPKENYENHHILPKSLFPELVKDKNNLVKLDYRAHYVAHHLLYRYYKSIGNKDATSKMACAWFMASYREDGLKVSSYQYEKAKIAMKLRPISEETRKNMSEAAKKRGLSEEYKEKQKIIQSKLQSGENNSFYKKHHTEETRKKISESKKGKPSWNSGKKGIYSAETLKKISESQKGENSKFFGTIWITNGLKTIRINKNDLNFYLDLGYKKGRKKE